MISRRDFARTAGVIAGAALVPRTVRADEGAAAPAAAHAGKKLAGASQAEADACAQLIVARHGARLDATQRADLQRLCREQQELLDELRAFPLDYADEPALQFRAPRTRR